METYSAAASTGSTRRQRPQAAPYGGTHRGGAQWQGNMREEHAYGALLPLI